MLKIGHRGAKGHAPENSLVSFQKAIELGVDMIELDVRLSLDKVPIVIHDETIDRTTSKTGLVTDYSAKELRQVDIPTLLDVFTLVNNRCEINVELKTFSATQPVLDLITQSTFDKSKILISSFDWNALQEIRFHDETLKIGVLTETDLDLALAYAKFIKAYSIHPYFHLLTAENAAKIKEKGFKIFPWTVNEPEDITFVISLGVDGIITDFPERL
ncbi:glycerophosphodiester phosphodiesterase [Flavobacterium sedimenticola]|uniref:Glycerophosphodiester phosphodiesterase family protein n=1 Tax=Flavobacterium sedimenticola TaxID=3043286 RepID=A0ABT6XND4_9FLAO|nr:glycerophosphodiester phosphodiesterase family protein [Flavobacterium sedimenticola]MDI9256492.1 glycerophosphodiester phosphodiesterase family protein [Flavobacterium sedimenticola]